MSNIATLDEARALLASFEHEISNLSMFPQSHDLYYLVGGTGVIQVENTLFKLDLESLLAQLPSLRNAVKSIFTGRGRLRYNNARPLFLSDVLVEDFEPFLWLIFPITGAPLRGDFKRNHWESILKLVTAFNNQDLNLHNTIRTNLSQF